MNSASNTSINKRTTNPKALYSWTYHFVAQLSRILANIQTNIRRIFVGYVERGYVTVRAEIFELTHKLFCIS